MKYVTHSEKETKDIAKKFISLYQKGAVICLDGQMGAGKTAFTKGALEALGYCKDVSSPTFAICHRYSASIPVLHFDLYRLKDEDDLYSVGFFDDIESGACVFIEWSGIAKKYLPDSAVKIHFEYGADDSERIITIEGNVTQ